jgi:predicted AAA+ superfamily ATPase
VSGANESVAGRAETIKIWPFSRGELEGYKDGFVKKLTAGKILDALKNPVTYSRGQYADIVSIGGYPEVIDRDQRRRNAYFRNYADSIVDHDAIEISGLAHLDKLRTLWALISAQTSGEFNQLAVSKKVQIPKSSLHAYLRLLQDLYLIYELPAWGRNLSSRIIGRKKISINDSGIACYFNGIDQNVLHDVLNGEIFGPILETYIVSELVKQQTWSDIEYTLYHFRNRDNKEVDIVIELRDGTLIGVEVKASKSVSQKDFQGMKALRDLARDRFLCGIILYSGTEVFPYGEDMYLAPLSSIWAK